MNPRITMLAALAVGSILTTAPADAHRYTAPQRISSLDASSSTSLNARTPRADRGAGRHRRQAARLASLTLSARQHAGAHRHARRGHCDGFIRCRCGVQTAAYNGLPLDYMGLNLKKASEYKRLPHTGFGAGVIAVKPGGHHALTVTGGFDCHNASIHDDRGDRHRNVCGWTFVTARAGGMSVSDNGNFNMGDIH